MIGARVTTSDRTAVSAPPTASTPRTGEVVGERYEIRHRLRDDPFSYGFLAFDQETEERVLLRVFRAELVEQDAAQILQRLRENVGIGGKYLPGLLDADRDEKTIYATEPLPEGAPLRAVLDRRIGENMPLTPEELLPVITHVDAALAAVPTTLHHGDVRADQVWMHPEGLHLMGAFFVPALPGSVLTRVLERHGDLRRRSAPEMIRGNPTRASDRYAVGAIVHEALTLEPPPDPGTAVDRALGPIAQPLNALLHPDPKRRSATLEPILETLSRMSGIQISELHPSPFRKPRKRMRRKSFHGVPSPIKEHHAPGIKTRPIDSTQTTPEVGMADATAPFKALDASAADHLLDSSGHAPLVDSDAQTAVRGEATTDAKTVVVGDPQKAAEEVTAVRTEPIDPEKTAIAPSMAGAQAKPQLDSGATGADEFEDDDTHAELGASADSGDAGDTRALRKLSETGEPVRQPVSAKGREPDSTDSAHHISVVESRHTKEIDVPSGETELDHSLDALVGPKSPLESPLDSGLDPRLVRAALSAAPKKARKKFPSDPGLDAEPDSDPSLDPRLVRAALGVSLDSDEAVPLDPSVPVQAKPGGTQQLQMDDLDFVDDDEPVAPKPKADGTQELRMEELDVVDEDGPEELAHMAAARSAVPEDVKPMPRPRRDSGLGFGGSPVLFDDSSAAGRAQLPDAASAVMAPPPKAAPPRAAAPRPVAVPPVAVPPVAAVPVAALPPVAAVPAAAPARAPRAEPPRAEPPRSESPKPKARPTPVLVEKAERPRAPRTSAPEPTRVAPPPTRGSNLGRAVIVTALVLGISIIIASFFYARHKKAQAEELRLQRIQQRLERIQQENEAGRTPGMDPGMNSGMNTP